MNKESILKLWKIGNNLIMFSLYGYLWSSNDTLWLYMMCMVGLAGLICLAVKITKTRNKVKFFKILSFLDLIFISVPIAVTSLIYYLLKINGIYSNITLMIVCVIAHICILKVEEKYINKCFN